PTPADPGDDLVFGVIASQFTNTNDFPPGTTFNSITIGASGYTLNGNSITLPIHSSITANFPNGSSTINLPLSSSGIVDVTVTSMDFTLVFGASLNAAGSVEKNGLGTAVFMAPATGGINWFINAGIANVRNGGVFGS